MGASTTPSTRLYFGPFELDPRSGELWKDGRQVNLPPQPTKLLIFLASRPGELVTRDEIKQNLWGIDTFVDFEHGLNFSIKKIRAAIGDNPDQPEFIQTLPRRGYRFIGSARTESPAVSPATVPHRRKTALPFGLFLAAAGVAVALIFAFGWDHLRDRWFGGVGAHRIESLAVLPLRNLSPDPEQEYFSDGMTDELITHLAKSGGLRVISHTSVERYKDTKRPLPEIARELGVDAVVEGTVMRSGERVRITAQLIDARSDRHLWADSYERDFRDVLSLQAEVAQGIANEIRIQLTSQQRDDLQAEARPVDPEAYESYLRGRYSWNKRTAEGLRAAIRYFNQAIARDPGFARAYAGMAECYAVYSFYNPKVPPRASYQKTRAAAEKALELDDRLAEAHTALAIVKFLNDGDWKGSQQEFQRAIDRNPNYAPAHQWYAEWLYDQARFTDAEAEMRKAYELDPLSLVIGTGLGDVFYYSHQFQRAVDLERQLLSLEPNFGLAHESLGFDYIQQSKFPEAVAEMQVALHQLGEDPSEYARLGYAYAMAGDRPQAETILRNLIAESSSSHPRSFEIALIYVGLREKNRAFTWLGRAVEERAELVSALGVDPIWDPLRGDPRFTILLSRLGLSQ